MTTRDQLKETLTPILDVVRAVDVRDPAGAVAALNASFPATHELVRKVRADLRAGVAAGTLCDRKNGDVKYSRVAKDAGGGWSIDAVHMQGAGGAHTHPNGEVDLCFAVDDAADASARFDGNAPGWTVYPPGSWHVPTVAGGRMDILYFLPGGAIVFGPQP